MTAALIQWAIATGTTIFVALVAFFQWRTSQQKAVLDLFDRRQAIYDVVYKAVETMYFNSKSFDFQRERELMDVARRAYFFFGDDVTNYLGEFYRDISRVCSADGMLSRYPEKEQAQKLSEEREAALGRILQFESTGQLLFARYMRFSQTVPISFGRLLRR
jgi:hypothetical protein